MPTQREFVEELLRRVPALQPAYEDHLRDNEELLPHVFMGDVTRWVIEHARQPEHRRAVAALLAYFESALATESDGKDLVLLSFVENLAGEADTVNALRPMLGQPLKRAIADATGL
jgi:hypothetical protein